MGEKRLRIIIYRKFEIRFGITEKSKTEKKIIVNVIIRSAIDRKSSVTLTIILFSVFDCSVIPNLISNFLKMIIFRRSDWWIN